MALVNEVEFTADIKSWVDALCRERGAGFPFKGAGIEKSERGRRQRRDFVLYDRKGRIALSGEFKLPDKPDGRNPYAEDLVLDAQRKADAIGVEYFFTSNVNRTVLWQTFQPGTPLADRFLDFFNWLDVRDSEELMRPENRDRLKKQLWDFIDYFAEIHRGKKAIPRHPLDKKFIHALESALDGPSNLTLTAITRQASADRAFERKVGHWAVRNLGGLLTEDDKRAMMERTARFSSYILAIKLVFYEALRRKLADLSPLRVPGTGITARSMRERLQRAFKRAERASGDYETVFEGDEFGDSLPLLVDEVVSAWIQVIEQIGKYDFTSIDYDVIGQIFDRLLSPQERHRYGQHYTRSEIVDLINAFCIREPDARVLDPACGGGTFLVRAYARKKWLEQKAKTSRSHEDRLAEIYGVDITSYATHLSVVSLATRDLGRVANYPRVACSDFFDVSDAEKLFPARVEKRLKTTEVVRVALQQVDAVVGNPPYVRQEMLTADQKKDYPNAFAKAWPGLKLSGRSDLHIYFWPHATSFLPATSGHFGFLTSSSWLDVDYGFALQRWILQNFCIEAIIESSVEPWFTDARVGTVVTILRRETDSSRRNANNVRFVHIRRPLADILADAQHADDSIGAAEELRRRILATRKHKETDDWRVRVVPQKDLIETPDGTKEAAAHTGAKWGIHLRAPDIFFELLDRFGDRFVKLEDLADVRFGLKSGCDAFFFPRDITDEVVERMSDAEFSATYGIGKEKTDRVRVCQAGDGTAHLIEAEYLEPIVFSVMELQSHSISRSQLGRRVLLVNAPKSALRGTRVREYIRYGETHDLGTRQSSPVHEKETVAARCREGRQWYDVTDGPRPVLCWPKAHQYRHIVSRNPAGHIVNCRLYAIEPRKGVSDLLLQGVLASSVTALLKFLFGRTTGREGNLDTMVSDTQMMLVPDPRRFSSKSLTLIENTVREIEETPILPLSTELEGDWRPKLDDAVLAGLGVKDQSERARIREVLYATLMTQLTETRDLERLAQKNRLKAARRGRSSPREVADEGWGDPEQSDTEATEDEAV